MPFNVEMPDGTVIEDVPDGTTKEQVLEKWKKTKGSKPERKENRILSAIQESPIAALSGAPAEAINQVLKPIGLGSEEPFGGYQFTKKLMTEEGKRAYGANVGHAAMQMARGLKGIVSTDEEKENLAREGKEESEMFNRLSAEEGMSQQALAGRLTPEVLSAYLTMKLPLPAKGSTLGAIGKRMLYGSGISGGMNMLRPTLPEGERPSGPLDLNAQTKSGQFAKGALANALIQGPLEGVAYGLNRTFGPQALKRRYEIDEKTGKPFAKAADKLEDATGTDFRISERFGSQNALQDEAEALANRAETAQKIGLERQKQVKTSVESFLERLNPKRIGRTKAAKLAAGAIEKEKNVVQAKIGGKYKSALDQAVNTTRGKKVVDMTPTLQKIDDKINEYASLGEIPPDLQDEMDNLIRIKNQMEKAGPMSFEQLDTWVKFGTQQVNVPAGQFKALESAGASRADRFVKSAIDDSVKFMSESSTNPSYANAARKYLGARKAYAAGKDYLDNLQKTSIGRLLDIGTDPTTEKIVGAISKKDADEVSNLMRLVDKYDPDAGNAVREHWLRGVVEKSKGSAHAKAGQQNYLDFKKFSDNMKLDRDFFARFKEPKTRDQFIRIKKGIDRLATEQNLTQRQTEIGKLEQRLSAVAGGHRVFIVKALVRGMSPDHFSKMLLTEEGRNAIITATDKYPDPRKFAAAMEVLKSYNEQRKQKTGEALGQ